MALTMRSHIVSVRPDGSPSMGFCMVNPKTWSIVNSNISQRAPTAWEKQNAKTARNEGLIWRSTRTEEHTSELQSLMRNSYPVICLKKKTHTRNIHTDTHLKTQQDYKTTKS